MQFERLGPYKIGKRLGRGGMGAVFEGVNVDTGESAAIKLLNPHLAEDEGFRERFEMEIETLKKLKHPNIVRMYGYGEQDSYLYYAMELVNGRSVEEELQLGRRFSWREVVHYSVALCKALRHAHDHGVIHRDLKPANLLLTESEDEIKLTDFGIARLFGNNRLTMDGALVGTAEYMSPEQASGERVTPQSDLYSLGGVMFAMLAGRPPFRTPALSEMLNKQRFEEPPPLSRFVTGIPPELEQFIARLLSKDPQARAPNALVLSRQLAAMEHGLSMVRQRNQESATQVGDELSGAADRTVSDRQLPYHPQSPTRAAEFAADAAEYDPNAATLLAPQRPDGDEPKPIGLSIRTALSSSPAPAVAPPAANVEVPNTAGNAKPEKSAPPPSAPAPTTPNRSGRFTTVEEDQRRSAEMARKSEQSPAIIQIVLLAISILMIVGLLFYFMRPPSAAKLYARIEAAANDPEPGSLLTAEEDVQTFLARFPNDERVADVKRYQDEINLERLKRRVRSLSNDALSPVEHDYLEAMNIVGVEPEQTIEKLQALVELYGALPDTSDRTCQCVELARRELQQLQTQAAKTVPQYLAVIDASLKRATQLRESSPEQARAIWQSIVTLYGDKTWAAAQVAKAKAALAETEKTGTADERR
jgi:eukaryotic-like serine/threonine-protein kinase